jgi:hypothetical protein
LRVISEKTDIAIEDVRSGKENELSLDYCLRHKESKRAYDAVNRNEVDRRDYLREYAIRNQATKREYDRRYRILKRDERKEYNRNYTSRNQDSVKVSRQQYAMRMRAEKRHYDREYYARNKDTKRDYFRDYYLRTADSTLDNYSPRSDDFAAKSWRSAESVREFFDHIGKQLAITEFTDWYRISRPQVAQFGGVK